MTHKKLCKGQANTLLQGLGSPPSNPIGSSLDLPASFIVTDEYRLMARNSSSARYRDADRDKGPWSDHIAKPSLRSGKSPGKTEGQGQIEAKVRSLSDAWMKETFRVFKGDAAGRYRCGDGRGVQSPRRRPSRCCWKWVELWYRVTIS
jgi:hypothetical protein